MTDCWIEVPDGSAFPLCHLPYGVVSIDGHVSHAGAVRIGDSVLLLGPAAKAGMFSGLSINNSNMFSDTTGLQSLFDASPAVRRDIRAHITTALTATDGQDRFGHCVAASTMARNHMAWDVADYVDFYSSEHHATNVGRIFRPDSDALTPNWKHMPIGYHGRAGTVVVSGTDVVRPRGQRKSPHEDSPTFGPSGRLDVEVEVGYVVGTATPMGTCVTPAQFADHVLGVVLVNDWSARDIQAWEYIPLGPFLGKSFATSVSAWITPLDALESARITPLQQSPSPLPYLTDHDPWSLDIDLELVLTRGGISRTLSHPPFATTYWTPGQQLAHMSVNGASLRVGDLFASGTVSGPELAQRGSLLELSWGGREPLLVEGIGEVRFLEDGDVITIRGWAGTADGGRLGLGEVTGTVTPAIA